MFKAKVMDASAAFTAALEENNYPYCRKHYELECLEIMHLDMQLINACVYFLSTLNWRMSEYRRKRIEILFTSSQCWI